MSAAAAAAATELEQLQQQEKRIESIKRTFYAKREFKKNVCKGCGIQVPCIIIGGKGARCTECITAKRSEKRRENTKKRRDSHKRI